MADKTYKFYSKGSSFRTTIEKPEKRIDLRTNQPVEHGGVVADFGPDGRFETGDSVVANLLREKETFNVYFFEDKGPVGSASPTEQDVTDRVLKAAVTHDVGALEAILIEEKTGHNRTALIGQIESTLADTKAVRDANDHNPGTGIVEAADKDEAEAKAKDETKKAAAKQKADSQPPKAKDEAEVKAEDAVQG